MSGPGRPSPEPRDVTVRQPRAAERPAERNGRGAYAAAAVENFAVMAPVAPHQGRHAPGAPGAPRPGTPDARNGGFARRDLREIDANGNDNVESNGHQPPFAVASPPHLNGADGTTPDDASNGTEPQGWEPRIERGDRPDRPDRTERPALRPGVRGEVGPLIESLHQIFERDRATASQGTAARCGICYLHHPRADLVYREAEGFYVCPTCAESLGATELNMVRRQQK